MPQGFIGIAIGSGIDPVTDSDTDAEKNRQTRTVRKSGPAGDSTSLTHCAAELAKA